MKRGKKLNNSENFKKEFFKVFHVAAFLFITIFFILPYLVQISVYFHEKSHQKVLDEYGVKNGYTINLLETIPNFWNPHIKKLGITRFDTEAYKRLTKYQKTEINLAGIVSDLRFLFLIGVYLSLVNVYTFYKIYFLKNYDLKIILAINWILFIWLISLIQITIANVSYETGDFYQLVKYLP